MEKQPITLRAMADLCHFHVQVPMTVSALSWARHLIKDERLDVLRGGEGDGRGEWLEAVVVERGHDWLKIQYVDLPPR